MLRAASRRRHRAAWRRAAGARPVDHQPRAVDLRRAQVRALTSGTSTTSIPTRPKGGAVRLGHAGSFDNLIPLIVKGTDLRGMGGSAMLLPVESLMVSAQDEPDSMYGLVAEAIELAEDRSWVGVHAAARRRGGTTAARSPRTMSFSASRPWSPRASPFYRLAYRDIVARVEAPWRAIGCGSSFAAGADRDDLPNLVAGHADPVEGVLHGESPSTRPTLDPPLGSGPVSVRPGRPGPGAHSTSASTDYWARDLPVNRGRYNFDTIRFDFYRDRTIEFEAFKAGEYDFREEFTSKTWATGYDVAGGARRTASGARRCPTNRPRAPRRSFSTPGSRSSPTGGSARRLATPSISSGPTRTCSSAFTTAPPACSRTRTCARAGRSATPERALLEPFRARASGRGVRRGLRTAGTTRWLGQHPRRPDAGSRAAGPSRMDRRRGAAGGCLGRADDDRVHDRHPAIRAHHRALCRQPEAAGDRRLDPHRRFGAVHEPGSDLRLRRNDLAVHHAPHARRRASQLLGLGRRRQPRAATTSPGCASRPWTRSSSGSARRGAGPS